MSIYTFTRLRTIISLMTLLAVVVTLLPMGDAAAQDSIVLTDMELRQQIFDKWSVANSSSAIWAEALTLTTIVQDQMFNDGSLDADVVIKQAEALRQRYFQQLGPRGKDPVYRESLNQRMTQEAIYAAALDMPNFKESAKRVYERSKIIAAGGIQQGISSKSQEYYRTYLEGNLLEDTSRALLKEQVDKAFARGQSDEAFVKAFDAVFAPITSIKLEDFLAEGFDIKGFLASHPEVGVPQEIQNAIQPDGSLEISLNDLDKLTRTALDNANAAIDDTQGTLGTLIKKQADLVDYKKNAQARQEAQALAEAKFAQNQQRLQAASSAISIISTIVGFKYPERARQISVVGQSLISVGESLNGWMRATASLDGLAKLGSLSTVVMTGNVLGAVMNIVSLFGPQQPTPEQIILEEIGKLRQQVNELRTEMHGRFDQIDHELNTIYTSLNARFDQIDIKLGKISGSLEEIQDTLLNLGMTLNRMERNNSEYFDTLGRRPLREAINGALGYQQRTGLDMPYQPDFVNYENIFQTWGTINAFDALSAGPSQRDYSDGQVFAELSAAPLDANVNYLNGWLQAHGMQPFANKRIASPRDWAFASRAYAQLWQDWPMHLQRIDPQRQATLDSVGADLEQALKNISTIDTPVGPQGNAPLFAGVTAYYSAKLQGVDAALQASQAAFVQEVQSARHRATPFELYGGLDQRLGTKPDSFTTITCGPQGLPPAGLAAPRHIEKMISSYNRFALADYLGTNPLTLCVDGSFSSLDPPCPNGPDTCDRYGYPRVVILARSDTTEIARFYVEGQRTKFDSNFWNVVAPVWETDFKPRFELYFVNLPTPFPLPPFAEPQLARVTTALTTKLAELQRTYAARIPAELGRGSLQTRVGELAGAKKLLESFITLGLPRATNDDDFLRSLLFSNQSLIDDKQIAMFYTAPSATQPMSETDLLVNPRIKLMQTAQKRRDALSDVLTDYLGSISAESYREDNVLVSGARFDLTLAKAFAEQNGPQPGQSWRVFLPLVQR